MRITFVQSTVLAGVAVTMLLLWSGTISSATADTPVLPRPAHDLPPGTPGRLQTAILAGGCFWCEEAVFEQLSGVTTVEAGYAGGTAATADYEHYHESHHAEAVRITYDPATISYGELLRVLFTVGDPTTVNGQEPDYGPQYRMAVFYTSDSQKQVAESYISQLEAAKLFHRPIAATVEALPLGFFPAEEYHQHYVARHPEQPYVATWSIRKIARVRAAFPSEVKPAGQTPPQHE